MSVKLKISRWLAPLAAVAMLAAFSPRFTAADDAPTTAPAASGASVTVTVVDASSSPVANARVTLTSSVAPADGSKPKPAGHAMTDADGKATISAIPDGDYNVMVASKSPSLAGKGTVTVADGKDATVDITAKPAKAKKKKSATTAPAAPANNP